MRKRTLFGLIALAMLPAAWIAHPAQAAPAGKHAAKAPKAVSVLAVGTAAPDFTLPTADNDKPLSLSYFKGHPVLLDFWASWCPPCKESLPHTQALADEFGRKGLTVLAVNSWDTRNGMATFLQAHPEYTLTVLFDDHTGTPGHRQGSLAYDVYHVSGIPTTYLIDKDGNVAASFVGYDDSTDKRIRAALAKLGVQ